MKKLIVALLILVVFLTGCEPADSSRVETVQQEAGVMAIVQNQPVPDLGGYSLERNIVIQTYLARNRVVSTYSYTMTLDGKIIELCPSIGYPIPYSTQLTSPEKVDSYNYSIVIPQSEPNGLYPPETSAATLVSCANPDGTVSPTYFELDVFAMPYKIKSDFQIERYDNQTSFSVEIK